MTLPVWRGHFLLPQCFFAFRFFKSFLFLLCSCLSFFQVLFGQFLLIYPKWFSVLRGKLRENTIFWSKKWWSPPSCSKNTAVETVFWFGQKTHFYTQNIQKVKRITYTSVFWSKRILLPKIWTTSRRIHFRYLKILKKSLLFHCKSTKMGT